MPTYYPPASFHFRVDFSGVPGMNGDAEARFQEVSGLSFEITTEEFTEGGENRFAYKLPKRVKYPNLVLKRGLFKDTAIVQWMQDAMKTFFTMVIYDFKPVDIMVSLLDEEDNALVKWNIVQAYPVKLSVSDLRANDNSIVVETLELAYQYFERT
jgi:phage tail-like protein